MIHFGWLRGLLLNKEAKKEIKKIQLELVASKITSERDINTQHSGIVEELERRKILGLDIRSSLGYLKRGEIKND